MLDKSMPYARVIMKRQPGTPVPVAELPAGFSFEYYRDGDELAWGMIEASVAEFEHADEATLYFRENYVPYVTELSRRTLFIRNEAGNKVATFTAWWNYTGNRRYPFMHWVAVMPRYQGLGLGRAIVAQGVQRMIELEGDCTMYIPTQTWSHKAIRLYRWAGFEPVLDEAAPGGFENQTARALTLIGHLL